MLVKTWWKIDLCTACTLIIALVMAFHPALHFGTVYVCTVYSELFESNGVSSCPEWDLHVKSGCALHSPAYWDSVLIRMYRVLWSMAKVIAFTLSRILGQCMYVHIVQYHVLWSSLKVMAFHPALHIGTMYDCSYVPCTLIKCESNGVSSCPWFFR